MVPAASLANRAVAYLESGPAASAALLRDVLGLARAPRRVADQVARSLVGDDPRVVRIEDGRWALGPTLAGDPPTGVALPETGLKVTCVSMGNPHCVMFVDSMTDALVLGIGPKIETYPSFPKRTNVEFVRVNNLDDVTMRVWERGSGETLACGTGACAVAVAGVLTGRTQRSLVAHLRGGDLRLNWSERDNHVYLTGPAVEVFRGEWPD